MASKSRNDANGSSTNPSTGNVFGRAFNKIAQKVVNVQQSISSSAQKAAERFLEEVTREELQVFGCLWETSETTERCRVCYVVFETVLANEKHHCRACGSVVCASCSVVVREEQLTTFMTQVLIPPTLCTDVVVTGTEDRGNPSSSSSLSSGSSNLLSRVTGGRQWRLCQPCLRGTVPSIAMREAFRIQLDKQNQTNQSTNNSSKRKIAAAVDQMGTKLVAKVNEVVGVKDDWQVAQGAENLPLFRGSFFPDTIPTEAKAGADAVFVPPRPPYSTLHPTGTPIGYAPPTAVIAAAAPQVTRLTTIPPAPRDGYLEIVNKSTSSSAYAVKVVYLPPHPFAVDNTDSVSGSASASGGVTLTPEALPSLLAFWQANVLFEAAKPTFEVLLPGQRCYSFVNAQPQATAVVAVVVLHDFDPATTHTLPAPPSSPSSPSSPTSAAFPVYGFRRARVFYFDVRQHHLLLKLRDPALLLPRQGTAVGRVGLLGYLQGRQVNTARASSVDYRHNVVSNLRVFDLL